MTASDERAELGELIVQVGLAMTMSGESVDGVQDRLYRIASAKGYTDVEVIALPTSLFVEFGSAGRATVRLGVPVGTAPRLDQVSELYQLVGELERNEIDTPEGMRRLDALLAAPPKFGRIVRILGYAVLCGGLSLLLQPAWGGLLAALVLGVLVGVLITWQFMSHTMVLPVLASFLVAVIVFAAAKWVDEIDNPIRSLIPPLIIFLPGAVLATGTVELAAGQVISGSTRLVQGVVVLGMMAFGIVAAAELVGAPPAHLLDQPFDRLGPWAPWVGLVVMTCGYYLHYCAPARTLLPILFVLVVAYLGQRLGALVFSANVSGFFGGAGDDPDRAVDEHPAMGSADDGHLPARLLAAGTRSGRIDRRHGDRRYRLGAGSERFLGRHQHRVLDRVGHPDRNGSVQQHARWHESRCDVGNVRSSSVAGVARAVQPLMRTTRDRVVRIATTVFTLAV